MKKYIIGAVTAAAFLLVCLYIFYNVLDIGMVLREKSPVFEYLFYGCTVIVFYYLVVSPMITILLMPYYSVAKYCDEDLDNNGPGLKSRATRLLKSNILDAETNLQLKNAINDSHMLAERMYIIYNNQIKVKIDNVVVSSSRDLLLLTAISQSRFGDMIIVLSNNFRMIKKIVVLCGFRPTFIRTCKLFLNVFATSLIADGMQKIEITSVLGMTAIKGPFKIITDSAANGIANSFFMLRIGMLTKQYLYALDAKKQKITLKNLAVTEAVKLFPSVVSSLVSSPLKSLISFVKPKMDGTDIDVEDEKDSKEFETTIDWNWKHKKT
jgi:hypothetical protein